ncbi:related to heterokaryon incompatibility protein (het-6OR allele) [Fusarium fujikuroi]|nr:related to heterokaryon incompatibility protein (het-6OR allele) [Fusarium fujikuroi]
MSLHGDGIRLLRLGANSSLTFKRVSLTDPARPPFVALSYVWGDLNDTLPLSVSGQTIAATRNLHHVLNCLFASRFDELLSIDALCIDQQNREERASQVSMMEELYSHARYVLAFLSPQSEPFKLGLDYLEATARDTMIHFDPSISPHLTVQDFNASDKPLQDSIISFFAAPWWTRVWTVQDSYHENSCCWAARRPIDGSAHGFLDIPSEINGGLTIYTTTLRMKHFMDMLVPGKLYTEEVLAAISLFRVRHCSDPRDRAFGYFGLRSPGLDMKREISVDYNMPVADLYKSLAVKLIERSQTLDVLSHVLHESGIRKRTEGLPSWVPDWDATIDDQYHLTYTERTNTIRNCYISGNMKPEWRMQDSGHVITPGLQIAEIQETAPGYPSIIPGSTLGGKTVISEWRRLAGLSVYSDASPIDMPSCNERERALENALSGGFVSMKWPPGSLEYSKAYHAWLEWFVSSQVALAKSCK